MPVSGQRLTVRAGNCTLTKPSSGGVPRVANGLTTNALTTCHSRLSAALYSVSCRPASGLPTAWLTGNSIGGVRAGVWSTFFTSAARHRHQPACPHQHGHLPGHPWATPASTTPGAPALCPQTPTAPLPQPAPLESDCPIEDVARRGDKGQQMRAPPCGPVLARGERERGSVRVRAGGTASMASTVQQPPRGHQVLGAS